VLHYPSEDKEGDTFQQALENKLAGDCAFQGTFFPKGNSEFEGREFRALADFSGATFYGDAYFSSVTFNEVRFYGTTFCSAAVFFLTTFGGRADFGSALFKGWTSFPFSTFCEDANFMVATIQDNIRFAGKNDTKVFSPTAQVVLNGLRIEKPERVAFETVLLRPSWFVGVDARKFNFTDVTWHGLLDGSKGELDKEVEALQHRNDVRAPYNQLSKACMSLSVNAEENRDYPTANEFHYWSMDAQRKETPRTAFMPWKLIWWYWVLSGYSESHTRAAMWLLAILVGFAALYIWLGPVGVKESSLVGLLQTGLESIVYSLGVMTRLAKEIPKSASVWATSLIIIEGVIGPLQIGIFLLAIRREFMR
jgi:hypothetical protein